MYICVCKQISEKQIISEINNGAKNFEAIQKKLGVSSECGSCLDCVLDVLVEHTEVKEYIVPIANIKHISNYPPTPLAINYIK